MTQSHGFEIRKITSGRAVGTNGGPVFGLRDTDKSNTWAMEIAMKYFVGETEVSRIYAMPDAEFRAAFPGMKGVRYDSWSVLVGRNADKADWQPISRKVNFKKHPSLHACGSRCINAKGHDCECSCHGKNHGAGRSMT